MIEKINELVQNSKKILITSHVSPDADAISSVLFTYNILRTNFPKKEIHASIEELKHKDFAFLSGFSDIESCPLIESLEKHSPELLIMVDGNNYSRFTSGDIELVKKLVAEKHIKTIIVDHHEENDKEASDVFYNNKTSSAVEPLYIILHRELGLKTYDGYADTVMTGIVGDTGRFLYKHPLHRQTFSVVSDLLDDGSDIERISNILNQGNIESYPIIAELYLNTKLEKDYTYSYISDELAKKIRDESVSKEVYTSAYHTYMSNCLRSTNGRQWGFVIVPHLSEEGIYHGSFRAIGGTIDTTQFTMQLGGGGHKAASAFKHLKAKSVLEAVDIVKRIIKSTLHSST